MINFSLLLISFLIPNTYAMENDAINVASMIQSSALTPEAIIVKVILNAPNQPTSFWPVLLYPVDSNSPKEPRQNSNAQLLFFYWKEFVDYNQFPHYLDQLVVESQRYPHRTEWNICFEDIYTRISELLKLALEVKFVFQQDPSREKKAKLMELFQAQAVLEDVITDEQNPERLFFAPYNSLILMTCKKENESIDAFQKRLKTIFEGDVKTLIDILSQIKKSAAEKTEPQNRGKKIQEVGTRAIALIKKNLFHICWVTLLIIGCVKLFHSAQRA